MELTRRVAPALTDAILDVGGGASTLVDGLVALGYRNVTVLDLSAAALGFTLPFDVTLAQPAPLPRNAAFRYVMRKLSA